ncbi:protein of unknown function [Streptantibioticus cattleyicolor NRRL 8057 = DSM 46488]|nr:protein of unknown function [Streptantibioticus cattleyicolor NRRL 8057 = DSM 46488]
MPTSGVRHPGRTGVGGGTHSSPTASTPCVDPAAECPPCLGVALALPPAGFSRDVPATARPDGVAFRRPVRARAPGRPVTSSLVGGGHPPLRPHLDGRAEVRSAPRVLRCRPATPPRPAATPGRPGADVGHPPAGEGRGHAAVPDGPGTEASAIRGFALRAGRGPRHL